MLSVVFVQTTIPTEQQLKQSVRTRLNYDVSTTSHKKGLTIYIMDWERNEFFKKGVAEFPTLCHLSSKRDILATITPNWARLEPIETRHREIPNLKKSELENASKQ